MLGRVFANGLEELVQITKTQHKEKKRNLMPTCLTLDIIKG